MNLSFKEQEKIGEWMFKEFLREYERDYLGQHSTQKDLLESQPDAERIKIAEAFIRQNFIVQIFMSKVLKYGIPASKIESPILDQIIKDGGYELPADPEKAYEGKGWKGWDDFLGTKEGGQ